MTIKDKDGKEWVLVPVEATKEMREVSEQSAKRRSVGDFLLAASTISAWLCGIVIAQGFASSLAAVIFPPWAWYLLAERAMQAAGWVQ